MSEHIHQYVREWWENKIFKGHKKDEENMQKFEEGFSPWICLSRNRSMFENGFSQWVRPPEGKNTVV